jgi:hypothetical protein
MEMRIKRGRRHDDGMKAMKNHLRHCIAGPCIEGTGKMEKEGMMGK